MNLLVNLTLLYALLLTIEAQSILTNPLQVRQNTTQLKTKRTIAELQGYGESKPVLVLVDNVASQSANVPVFYSNPKSLILKPVFESEVPKVAAQQVLYEFQQTPTNAVSNVHVNQLFQPYDYKESSSSQVFSTEPPVVRQPYAKGQIPNQPNQQPIQSSETIANPVQHAALINHGQNYAHVQFHPGLPPPGTPQHIQTHHYIPGKYLYVNGKIIYQPTPVIQNHQVTPQNFNTPPGHINQYIVHQQGHPQQHPQSHQQVHNQNSLTNTAPQTYGHQHNIHTGNKRPITYITYNNPRLPKQNLTPPPKAAPMAYSKFQPPKNLQQITKPMNSAAPEREEEEEAEEDDEREPLKDEEVEESEDDDEDERSNYKEEDEDEDEQNYEESPSKYYERYRYHDDDDDSDGQRYYQEDDEAEEDEDNQRGSTKVVTTKARKHSKKKPGKKYTKSPKYDKSKDYKYSEAYSTKSEYESPKSSKKGKSKGKSKPKGYYKTVKYTKQANGKPKIETIEGKQSQHVPVVEKRKVFQERWVVSKSTDASSA